MSVLAGQLAGRALVVATDFALGQLVEQEAAGLVEGFGGDYFAAEIAEVCEPVSGVEGELSVDLFAEALGQGRAGSGGGDSDLEVAAPNYGGEVEVAERWVVYGVAEDSFFGGFCEDGPVDGGDVGRGYDEEVSGEVALLVGAGVVLELAGCGPVENALAGMGGDDGDAGICGLEGLDLRFGEMACADDNAWPGSELQEDRKQRHAIRLLLPFAVCGAYFCCSDDFGVDSLTMRSDADQDLAPFPFPFD